MSGKISGTITESDQQTAVPNASIIAFDSNGDIISVDTTDSSGDYELKYFDTGTYTVKVLFDGGLIASSNSVYVTEGSTTDQDFSAPGGSISGTVTDSNATAISAAKVKSTSKGSDGGWIYEATTDGSGNYEIEKLPAGNYDVTVESNDFVGTQIADVTVTSGQETANQDFSIGSAGKISGTVTDSSQEAIEGAAVLAMRDNDVNDANIAPNYSTTDPNGNYTMDHLRGGTYKIFVCMDGYVSEIELNVVVTVNQTTSGKDFTLGTSGGMISGTVYESNGSTPIPNALVSCVSDANSFGSVLTDSSGNYSLDLLQAATYTLTAGADGFDGEDLNSVVVTGTQENSGNDFTLDAQ